MLFIDNILKLRAEETNRTQCLILLQKLIIMRPMFLGEYRIHIGKCYTNGINELIKAVLNKANLDLDIKNNAYNDKSKKCNFNVNNFNTDFYDKNMEQLCKLIYCLKKNFSYKELIEFQDLIENVYKLCLYLIINFTENLNGLIYLMLFFGYFSKLLNNNHLFEQDTIINIIFDISKKIIDRIFFERLNPLSNNNNNNHNNLSINRSNINNLNNNSFYNFNNYNEFTDEIGEDFYEADENLLKDFYYAFGDLTTGM